MRKFFMALALASMVIILFAGSASALTYVITDTYLGDTTNFVAKNGTTGMTYNSRTDIVGDPGYQYNFTISGTGWQDIQVGDSFDLPNNNSGVVVAGGDLSAYNTFQMTFHNPNTSGGFMANVYLNTGWTDAPFLEKDVYTENGWTWVLPGQTVTLSLDLTSVPLLNHVSDIGFKIGSNVGTGDYAMSGTFDVQVVPLPGALLLMGAGLFRLAAYGRRRKSAING